MSKKSKYWIFLCVNTVNSPPPRTCVFFLSSGQQRMSKPNERSCRFFGIFRKVSPLLTGLSSKCHNFFFYLVSVEFGKVCSTKVFTLSVYQKKFEIVFSTIFTLLFQKSESFLPKIAYMIFHPLVVLKALNLKELWLFKHIHDGKNGRFFWFFPKVVIYTKLLLLGGKLKKSSIFPIMSVCLNNHNFFKFEAFSTISRWKSI